jgi:hypothetical protein
MISVTLDMNDVKHARQDFKYVELSTIPLAGIRHS